MSTDMVKYYFKCPDTGVEVTFSKTEQWGYAVQYHVSKKKKRCLICLSPMLSYHGLSYLNLNREWWMLITINCINHWRKIEH